MYLLSRQLLGVLVVAFSGWVTAKLVHTENDNQIVLENGYTYLVFNKLSASIEEIAADFSGNSGYSKNLLTKPFSLQVSEVHNGCAKVQPAAQNIQVKWLDQSEHLLRVRVSNILDENRCNDAVASEEWVISLSGDQRAATVDISGEILRDAKVDFILHGIYSDSPSLYGLFPKGVSQMMGNTNACMGSTQPLSRAYVLGNGAAMDILRHDYGTKYKFNENSVGISGTGSPSSVVFKSAHDDFASGIEDVLFGSYPDASNDMLNAWNRTCWANTVPTAVTKGAMWSFSLTFLPNNYDFPAYLLNAIAETTATVPFEQLRAYLTGAYASPAGCLQSYYGKQFGMIAPTISTPDIGYSPDTNFFDPDNFISLSALLYTGDAYFLRQVKSVLMRTAATMCGIGREQVEAYCNTTLADLKNAHGFGEKVRIGRQHQLHSTSRFTYSDGDGK